MYIAARSEERCRGAVDRILEQTRNLKESTNSKKTKGKLESMVVDLSDLATVKPAVDGFLKRAERLDVLMHNAAVMEPPKGSKDKLVGLTFFSLWD